MCVFLFFFKSYEITVYCFSSCLTLIVFSPYTTEVHREYVAVAGHGAWLAVLLFTGTVCILLQKSICIFFMVKGLVYSIQLNSKVKYH